MTSSREACERRAAFWAARSRAWLSVDPAPRRERPRSRARFASPPRSGVVHVWVPLDERGALRAARNPASFWPDISPRSWRKTRAISPTELNAQPRAFLPRFSRACRPTVSTWAADFGALRYEPVTGAVVRVKAAKRRRMEGSLDARGRSRKIAGG